MLWYQGGDNSLKKHTTVFLCSGFVGTEAAVLPELTGFSLDRRVFESVTNGSVSF